MKRFLFCFALMASLILWLAACQAQPEAAPADTATPESTVEPEIAPTDPPTWTPTPLPPPTAAIPPTPIETPTPEATPTPALVEVWVNAVDGLNLRAEAKADGALVATLKHQQHLVALSPAGAPDATGTAWQNVRTDDGKTGWASAQYLTTTNPASPTIAPTTAATTAAATPAATAVVLTATPATTAVPGATAAAATPAAGATPVGDVWVIARDGLNLRAEPNTTAAVLTVLQYGQKVTALTTPTAPDAGGIAWQNIRTEASQTGWAAAASLSATAPITGTATPTSTTPPGATNPNTLSDLLQRINDLRQQNGLSAVEFSSQLTASAQRHSLDMAQTGNVSQTGSDASTAIGRMQAAGYAGEPGEELINGGQLSIDDVWSDWLNNRRNANVLLNPKYIRVGIAVASAGANHYYTADFGGP